MKPEVAFEKAPDNAGPDQNLQTMALTIEKLIENVTTQGQINSSIVGRLLVLERKVEAGLKQAQPQAREKHRRRAPARKKQ